MLAVVGLGGLDVAEHPATQEGKVTKEVQGLVAGELVVIPRPSSLITPCGPITTAFFKDPPKA